MTYRAFLDANVLVQSRVRDVLLTLADLGTFDPLWSERVLQEVSRNLPVTMAGGGKEALFRAMEAAFPEAMVSWPGVVDIEVRSSINLSDQHVVAAALWAGADALVTEDARLADECSDLVDVQLPGVFAAYAIDIDPMAAAAALVDMARRRWLDDESVASSEHVLDRLVAWMGRHGWAVAAPLIDAEPVRSGIDIALDEHLERARDG